MGWVFENFRPEVTGEIRATAREVQGVADDVRRLAGSVAGLGSVAWESSAAQAFRRRIGDEATRILTVADAVEAAAVSLRRHAHAVDQVVEEVTAGLRGARGVGRVVVGGVGRLAGEMGSLGGGLVRGPEGNGW